MAEEGDAGRLMSTLISKMESMDTDMQLLKAENASLRRLIENPNNLLRKAGFLPYGTPLSEDVDVDAFRNDMDTNLLKGEKGEVLDKYSNEQIHEMSWEEIHEMASQHKEVKEMY
ncbi:MAG: hypothetical protein CMJ17_00945 [Phenylobacterium sp.]|nr:hypothetical protein [Phenylobacterium sp.]|tara:strand:+ start:590 stop:934 length:345 start_codon:yes stop_codon:yes gene_type:complete